MKRPGRVQGLALRQSGSANMGAGRARLVEEAVRVRLGGWMQEAAEG